MSSEKMKRLSEELVAPLPAGACLDHCMRGVKFAAGLIELGNSATVEIVQAFVQGQDDGKSRAILHCWVELQQAGTTMVMDATANKPVSTVKEYYESRQPTSVKRYSPNQMHDLLSQVGQAEWFERTPEEIAAHTGPKP